MTDRKPRARQGRKPRTRGGSSAARQESSRASKSRSRMKGRILALEGQLSTLRSWVGDLHEAITGESVRVHPDDLAGVAEEE